MRDHGYEVFVADPGIWCPFDDGTSYAQFLDHDRTVAHMRDNGFSDADIEGQFAYEEFFDGMRRALRKGPRDAWQGDAPDRAELEELLGHDPELVDALFETSIADVTARFVKDERLHTALYGQGVIGAWAGPRDPGTASIKLMHFSGELEGVPDGVGLRRRRHGPHLVRDRRSRAGAGCGARHRHARRDASSRVIGVELEGGESSARRHVVSNADPKVTARLLRRRRDRRVHAEGRRLADPEPGHEAQLRALAPPAVDRRARRRLPEPRTGVDRAPDRRGPAGVRATARAASRGPASPSSTSRPRTTRRSRPRASTR